VEGLTKLEVSGDQIPDGDHAALLAEHEERIKAELSRARCAVDAELAEGRGHACAVEALRASPQRPASVVEFPDVATFIEQDPIRGLPASMEVQDAGGADFGKDWNLENLFRRWETTTWRISWLGNDEMPLRRGVEVNNEVYAVELGGWLGIEPGRVWLLGKLRTLPAVEKALRELFHEGRQERNSLAAAAASVAAVMKEEEVESAS
jgi:hypothetical protein